MHMHLSILELRVMEEVKAKLAGSVSAKSVQVSHFPPIRMLCFFFHLRC